MTPEQQLKKRAETRGIIEGHGATAAEVQGEYFDGAVKLEDGLILIHDLDHLLARELRLHH